MTKGTKPVVLKQAAQTPFNIEISNPVAAPLNLTKQGSQAIAESLQGRLVHMPKDDFMPAYLFLGQEYAEPIAPPSLVPAIIDHALSNEFLVGIKWLQIKNLPGMAVSQIRKLGRDTFGSFDCFQSYADKMKAAGKDALTEVLTISDLSHGQTATNHLAALIMKNGVPIETGHIDYGPMMPGYNPDIIIMMTERWTFKLVKDSTEKGAPVDANYIYAWPGGHTAYKKKLAEAQPRIQRLPSAPHVQIP